ncbi:winged helix-turn-helix transcriptional regulator [Amphiplicatus metriothermophilus]|uniref:Transcriptional regulator, HxlR family n=1 Tax=Amphiplicatus metriothermophilus TaxID=1519374 RepID=A0A239PPC8_9PROT|nr:helix-turn-helix domain-containing protein [Amphiplicatus metriothermophilus]MBB5518682.1 DNA-binding HxlR family transcriptional regulator [Amphiplicatus metriothermophilus]SNT72161.1 transcriptional regulator, HxlR family [Amphiplicatus metriothermophilus]
MALRRRKNKAPPLDGECPLMACMKLLGGAWTPNIVWYLSAGPRRFSELRHDIPGVSSKVLSARLKELVEKGVVSREVRPTSPPSVEYALTEIGAQLVPVIDAIVAVGKRLKEEKARASSRSRQAPDRLVLAED